MSNPNEVTIRSDVQSPSSQPAETPGPLEAPRLLFNPPIDIYETEDGLVLYADLPGVTREGLDLQVQDNRLILFGRIEQNDLDGTVMHEEYKMGNFLRSFILSDEVDHERISASLNNGVLRVELPRASRGEAHRIEITTD